MIDLVALVGTSIITSLAISGYAKDAPLVVVERMVAVIVLSEAIGLLINAVI